MTACDCACHSGPGAFLPPCDVPGGCGHLHAETARSCQRGQRCVGRIPVEHDGRTDWQGAPCDRPLCTGCERRAADTLDDTPRLWALLRAHTLMPPTTTPTDVPIGKRTGGHPLPGNGHARHLAEQVHWLLTTWEDEVRSIASLSYPQRDGKRHQTQVNEAAELLAAHLSAWTAAPAVELHLTRTADNGSDTYHRIEQTGAEAVCELLDWREQVRRLPGFDVRAPKAVRRYLEPCPACGVRAVIHRAGDDLMQCQNCWGTHPYKPTLPREADYRTEGAA